MASCITILWINVPYFIAITGLVFVMWYMPVHISFHEIIFAWIPITTSACNPIIILTRTSAARAAVLGLFRGRNSSIRLTRDSVSQSVYNWKFTYHICFLKFVPDPPRPGFSFHDLWILGNYWQLIGVRNYYDMQTSSIPCVVEMSSYRLLQIHIKSANFRSMKI